MILFRYYDFAKGLPLVMKSLSLRHPRLFLQFCFCFNFFLLLKTLFAKEITASMSLVLVWGRRMIVWLALYLWRRYSLEGVDCLVGSSVTNSKEQSQTTKHCQRIFSFSLTLPSFHPKLMMLAFIYLTKTLKACF
ncbi:hypothetical protein SLE2022_095310 [Rubroshorea leprosula]